jgi:transposase
MQRSSRNHETTLTQEPLSEVQGPSCSGSAPGDATLADLGSRHGVHATQIAAWRKQALEHLSEVFDNGNPVLEDAERHIRDLRAKVGELTMERDFLAGALGRGGLPSAKR